MILEIDTVWCRTFLEFNTIKQNDCYDSAVSYHKIYHRLLKADPDGVMPSDLIISIQIKNEIKKAISKNRDNERIKILYLFKDLNASIVSNFSEMVKNLDITDFEINLIVVNNKELEDSSVIELFDKIKNLDI